MQKALANEYLLAEAQKLDAALTLFLNSVKAEPLDRAWFINYFVGEAGFWGFGEIHF